MGKKYLFIKGISRIPDFCNKRSLQTVSHDFRVQVKDAAKVEHNQINNISPLLSLTNLEKIYLGSNPLSQAQVDELKAALPNCEVYF